MAATGSWSPIDELRHLTMTARCIVRRSSLKISYTLSDGGVPLVRPAAFADRLPQARGFLD